MEKGVVVFIAPSIKNMCIYYARHRVECDLRNSEPVIGLLVIVLKNVGGNARTLMSRNVLSE